MDVSSSSSRPAPLILGPVDHDNWEDVARLTVNPEQASFVAEPTYYLAMCNYGDIWHPLAITIGDKVIGMLLWGIDLEDDSCWFGGVIIDKSVQGQGHGKRALQAALSMMAKQGHRSFALSYEPTNVAARRVYHSLGFRETGEVDDTEVIARLDYDAPQQ